MPFANVSIANLFPSTPNPSKIPPTGTATKVIGTVGQIYSVFCIERISATPEVGTTVTGTFTTVAQFAELLSKSETVTVYVVLPAGLKLALFEFPPLFDH